MANYNRVRHHESIDEKTIITVEENRDSFENRSSDSRLENSTVTIPVQNQVIVVSLVWLLVLLVDWLVLLPDFYCGREHGYGNKTPESCF